MEKRKRTAKLSISMFPEELDMFKMYSKQLSVPMSEIVRDALNSWLNLFSACTDKDDYEYWKYKFKV